MSEDTKIEEVVTGPERNYDKMKNTDLFDLCIERGIVFDPKTPRPTLVSALISYDSQETLKKKVKIKVHNQDSMGGGHPIQVGWNEKRFVIPREIVVSVPLGVVKVMESCVERKSEMINGKTVVRDYPRFSFNYIND